MTALAGYARLNDEMDVLAGCVSMLRAQERYANRAPAIVDDPGFAMGIAPYRLSSERFLETKPLIGGHGRFVLAADIAINDRSDWIARLGMDTAEASQLSDAALLMAGWERWQAGGLEQLNADFAFALWDRDRRELNLARDFVGQRPLFYHQGPDWVACASMPAGLLAVPEIPLELDRAALAEFVGLSPPFGRKWFYHGVRRVVPGTLVRISRAGIKETVHWQPERHVLELGDPAEYSEAAQEVFDRAVAARLGTGLAVGCHLSAGLDSGAVMASAARQLPDGQRLRAYTAAPPSGFVAAAPRGRLLDEAPLAALSAGAYANVDHTVVRSESADPTTRWERAFWLFQAPLPNPCNFMWGSGLNDTATADGIERVLTGALGNLSFSYRPRAYYANLLASGAVVRLVRDLAAARSVGRPARALLRETLYPLLPMPVLRALERARGRSVRLEDCHFGREAVDSLSDDVLIGRPARDGWQERVDTFRMLDLGVYNKGILAGWGLDMRDPTADRALVELCLSIPDAIYQHRGRPRALAHAMLAGRLPEAVLAETRRGYQAADWRIGVRKGSGSLAEEIGRSVGSPMAAEVIDGARATEALRRIGADPRPGQADELRLREGLMRAAAAAFFIRRASGRNE